MFDMPSVMTPQRFSESGMECNVVLVGDSRVGKSALISQFVNRKFSETYRPTSYDKVTTTQTIMSHKVKFVIWDTSGSKSNSHKTSRIRAYRAADIILLCYKVSDPSSLFAAIHHWCSDVRNTLSSTSGSEDCPPIVLVGLQSDTRNSRDVLASLARVGRAPLSAEQGITFSQQIDAVTYVECSAKFGSYTMKPGATSHPLTTSSSVSTVFEVAALTFLGQMAAMHEEFVAHLGAGINDIDIHRGGSQYETSAVTHSDYYGSRDINSSSRDNPCFSPSKSAGLNSLDQSNESCSSSSAADSPDLAPPRLPLRANKAPSVHNLHFIGRGLMDNSARQHQSPANHYGGLPENHMATHSPWDRFDPHFDSDARRSQRSLGSGGAGVIFNGRTSTFHSSAVTSPANQQGILTRPSPNPRRHHHVKDPSLSRCSTGSTGSTGSSNTSGTLSSSKTLSSCASIPSILTVNNNFQNGGTVGGGSKTPRMLRKTVSTVANPAPSARTSSNTTTNCNKTSTTTSNKTGSHSGSEATVKITCQRLTADKTYEEIEVDVPVPIYETLQFYNEMPGVGGGDDSPNASRDKNGSFGSFSDRSQRRSLGGKLKKLFTKQI